PASFTGNKPTPKPSAAPASFTGNKPTPKPSAQATRACQKKLKTLPSGLGSVKSNRPSGPAMADGSSVGGSARYWEAFTRLTLAPFTGLPSGSTTRPANAIRSPFVSWTGASFWAAGFVGTSFGGGSPFGDVGKPNATPTTRTLAARPTPANRS